MQLPTPPPVERLEATRLGWHRLAEHALAALRWRVERRLGLVVARDGFGTPRLPDGRAVHVAGRELVVDDGRQRMVRPLTTVGDAAAVLGIPAGAASDRYPPQTDVAPDAPLDLDDRACRVLAAWFALGDQALRLLGATAGPGDAPSTITLWPEHFDVAVELGDATCGARGTFGASPGDGAHPFPYLYVTHWSPVADDPFWNDPSFAGASLAYTDVANADDPLTVARAFFGRGYEQLRGGES